MIDRKFRDEVGEKLVVAFGIPKCPLNGCHADARRPKCFFELGASCSRHEILSAWEDLLRSACIYYRLQLDEQE